MDVHRLEFAMARTRIFKSGNSQAVRIPAELAYDDVDIDLEISRHGDVITVFPARATLARVVETLRKMPKPALVEKRRPIEMPERRNNR